MKTFSFIVFFSLSSLIWAVPEKAKSPDLKGTLLNLALATRELDSSKEPIDFVDQVKVWENLILSCNALDKVLTVRIQGVSEQLEEYEVKTERNPSKAKFYRTLANRVERQLDQLYGIKKHLSAGAKKLKEKVDFVRSDPEIAEILDLESKQEKLDSQLVLPNKVIPPAVNRAIEKATD